MSIFSKKNKKDIFTILDEIDDNVPATESGADKSAEDKPAPKHALTPEELLSHETKPTAFGSSSSGALESLKKRLTAAADNYSADTENALNDSEIPPEEKPSEAQSDTKSGSSLLDKCLPYILDDEGNNTAEQAPPLYKLQTVAEILKSDSEKTLERLSEKYGLDFKIPGSSQDKPKEEAKKSQAAEAEENIFEESIPAGSRIKNAQSNVPFVISDIDTPSQTAPEKSNDISNTATVTFTPISDENNNSHITISTQTRPIDLTGEITDMPEVSSHSRLEDEVHLEMSEFEEYIPDTEFDSEKSSGKLLRLFSIKNRRAFLSMTATVFLNILLVVAAMPFFSQILALHPTVSMIICSAIAGIIILLNCDMFLSLPKAFGKKSVPDICAALASVTTATYAFFAIAEKTVFINILLMLAVSLSFRAISKFFKTSYMLSNFKQISSSSPKHGLRLISDTAVTFAMAKTSIEGDALIAAPQKANHIADYMKYSTFGTTLGGKLPLITVLSVILSVISGFACAAYFDGAVYGFYAAAAIQCFTALPAFFLIESLPLYRASKKLNREGAAIFGKSAAEQIEMANAAVFSATDLFPAGTVVLHQMKVLSENDLEDTLVRAASLTDALDSTLAPIFKQIAGTGNIEVLPDSDTVKYEDKMGISGWVDNRLLFIGNRTLMEAHGIDVPSVEVDRKILRQGFFPVYLATRDKACALLVIQYNPDRKVARELRRLTVLGITLLISSSDPNLTEEMICDYLGLYNDSIMVMSSAGCHMYKNTASPTKELSAPAAYRRNNITLAKIINCATKIKRSVTLLTAIYIICAALGILFFAYSSLGGSGILIKDSTLLLYSLISTVITYLIYLVERP
ncbi:MAG: hypothetical protein IKD04_05690 [Clostridia bacterium]|nr:hypothetical protein [Clostridia bacterium]